MKEVILNIDVWLSSEGNIYIHPQEGEDVTYIPAGSRIRHEIGGLFVRRIKDEKIIFGPDDLPPRKQQPSWHWKGIGKE